MVRFSTESEDIEIHQKAESARVGLMSARPHYLQGGGEGEFVLGYGELEEDAIKAGIFRAC